MKGIGRLVKLLKVTLIIYNLEGLYGIDPRWGNGLRKGKSQGKIRKVLTYEEYKDIPHDEFDKLIENLLSVSAVKESQLQASYKSSRKAEYLERVLFLCPDCNSNGFFYSEGNTIYCKKCGYTLEYRENLSFKLIKGSFFMKNVKEFYDYQTNYMQNCSEEGIKKMLPLTSQHEIFGQELRGKQNIIHMKNASVCMTFHEFTVSDGKKIRTFLLDEIEGFAIHGRNTLLFFTKDAYFFLKGEKRRNAVQFLYFFYTIKRITGRNEDGFFGI